jgi:hypothetical protein
MEPATDNLAPYHPGGLSSHRGAGPSSGGAVLLDVLDRVLDKGVVIAGDIRINLLDIELLTIKVRLLISSADKAKEMGSTGGRATRIFRVRRPNRSSNRARRSIRTPSARTRRCGSGWNTSKRSSMP